MNKRQTAKELYENKGLTLAEISRQLETSYSTVRSWKHRDKKQGLQWAENYKSRKRCMAKSQLDNLVLFEAGNRESFKHGLYSKRLSPEAQELFNNEFKENASNPYIYSICLEYCRYVCSGKGLDYSSPTGLIAESRQAMKVCKMIVSYIELKDVLNTMLMLDSLGEKLEPEQQAELAGLVEVRLKDKTSQIARYFPEAEALLKQK